MSESFNDLTKHINKHIALLRKDIPDTTKGFSELAGAAVAEGVLDKKTKEFIALAIAVKAQCKPCIAFHVKALVRLGATREEVSETLGMCVYMGGGPSLMYSAEAIAAFEEFSADKA